MVMLVWVCLTFVRCCYCIPPKMLLLHHNVTSYTCLLHYSSKRDTLHLLRYTFEQHLLEAAALIQGNFLSNMAPVVEVWGDVFAMPTALAHAVSTDLHMSAGVAVQFKEYFGGVEAMKQQQRGVGEVAFQKHHSYYVFYLITKKNYWDKYISLDDVSACLSNLRSLCVALGVSAVSMPRIGCGLDSLSWNDVLPRIVCAFSNCSVRVNVVTPPPHFRGMAVLGDSQGLRFLLARGVLPDGISKSPYPKTAGLCTSGINVSTLIDTINVIPDNGLGDVIVFIGSNDLLAISRATEGHKQMKRSLRGKFAYLRTKLSAKCKPNSRAVVLTIPPLPTLLAPKSGDGGEARYLWSFINKGLADLSTNRFFVLDVASLFMKDGVIQEDMFESVMGRGCNQREDRIHINNKGMNAIVEALQSLPPFKP